MADSTIVANEPVTTAPQKSFDARAFWTKNSKLIIGIGAAVVILLAAWAIYKKFVVEPKETASAEAIFPVENLFAKTATAGTYTKDTVNILLNGGSLGNENYTGLLKVYNNYGGTSAHNRAAYMIGASYLHLGDFDKAIKYLKEFDAHGASQVQVAAYEMLGHAYAEKKDQNQALEYYKKASTVNEKDEYFTAQALFTAASYAEAVGKKSDAIDLYKSLRDKYPASGNVANGDVDKALAKLGVVE